MSPFLVPVDAITQILDLLDEREAEQPHEVRKNIEMSSVLMALRLEL